MFSGIVEQVGKVVKIEDKGDQCITIQTSFLKKDLKDGSSICCNGICLTVHTIKKTGKFLYLSFDVSNETIECTNFSSLKVGSKINLEKSLKVGDEISGHFVFGHVDTKVKLKSIRKVGKSYIIEFSLPNKIKKFLTKKGSISINGISLTVNKVTKDSFYVNIVDYTWNHTNFKDIKIRDIVNIEVDMLARYVTSSKN
ncbi:MAG: riboflavin synthase [Candidatus Pelagibacterales bacterium]|jgi:riboflavin synthase|tara:strand:- start:2678 stop:3271 length:594 start_codon:yes stop_codon:yes gene_type:complete